MISFQNVSKSYAVYNSPGDRLKELLTLQRRSYHRDFWALQDVTFHVEQGESFCIIGENGSGKSTLLQIIAGILHPTSGQAQVDGRVAALLELGSGFNPEFTGHDNIYLNGSILGLSRKEIAARYRSIIEFAEIGQFIHQPVKTYSSGMVVRLAFAVAIHVDPEVLLVDEALAVGDIYFRQRCMRKVHELRQKGVTIIFVSHAMGDVKAIGDRALWLDAGQVKAIGKTDQVVSQFLAAMVEKDSAYLSHAQLDPEPAQTAIISAPELATSIPNIDRRYGDARAEIVGISVLDAYGDPISLLEPGTTAVLRISLRASSTVRQPLVGFVLRNHLGLDLAATNTLEEGHQLPALHAGDSLTVDFHLDLPQLYPAHFSFSPAIADGDLLQFQMCDWIDNAITLQMSPGDRPVHGYLRLPCRVEINSRLSHRPEVPVG